MSFLSLENYDARTVIALATSKAWHAALRRTFAPVNLVWALNDNDLLIEAKRYRHAPVVIEVSGDGISPERALAGVASLRWLLESRRRVFLVTQIIDQMDARPFRRLGISDVIVTIGNAERLMRLVQKHYQHSNPPNLTIEEQVEAAMPWR